MKHFLQKFISILRVIFMPILRIIGCILILGTLSSILVSLGYLLCAFIFDYDIFLDQPYDFRIMLFIIWILITFISIVLYLASVILHRLGIASSFDRIVSYGMASYVCGVIIIVILGYSLWGIIAMCVEMGFLDRIDSRVWEGLFSISTLILIVIHTWLSIWHRTLVRKIFLMPLTIGVIFMPLAISFLGVYFYLLARVLGWNYASNLPEWTGICLLFSVISIVIGMIGFFLLPKKWIKGSLIISVGILVIGLYFLFRKPDITLITVNEDIFSYDLPKNPPITELDPSICKLHDPLDPEYSYDKSFYQLDRGDNYINLFKLRLSDSIAGNIIKNPHLAPRIALYLRIYQIEAIQKSALQRVAKLHRSYPEMIDTMADREINASDNYNSDESMKEYTVRSQADYLRNEDTLRNLYAELEEMMQTPAPEEYAELITDDYRERFDIGVRFTEAIIANHGNNSCSDRSGLDGVLETMRILTSRIIIDTLYGQNENLAYYNDLALRYLESKRITDVDIFASNADILEGNTIMRDNGLIHLMIYVAIDGIYQNALQLFAHTDTPIDLTHIESYLENDNLLFQTELAWVKEHHMFIASIDALSDDKNISKPLYDRTFTRQLMENYFLAVLHNIHPDRYSESTITSKEEYYNAYASSRQKSFYNVVGSMYLMILLPSMEGYNEKVAALISSEEHLLDILRSRTQ